MSSHSLATRPVFLDEHARPHRTRAVIPFLGQHETPTPIQLRTCGSLWVGQYVRDILQSNIVSRIVNSTAPGMADNHTTSDPTSGPGHEKTLKRSSVSVGVTSDIELLKVFWTLFKHESFQNSVSPIVNSRTFSQKFTHYFFILPVRLHIKLG